MKHNFLIAVTVGLLIFFSFTSFDFLQNMLPARLGLIPIVGVIGLGVGAILWEFAGHRGAKTEDQATIAIVMVFVNITGDLMAFIGEVMMGDTATGLPAFVSSMVTMVVIAILGANVVAGALYRMKDPAYEMAREKARQDAEAERAKLDAAAAEQDAQTEIIRQRATYLRQNAQQLAAEQGKLQAQHILRQVGASAQSFVDGGDDADFLSSPAQPSRSSTRRASSTPPPAR